MCFVIFVCCNTCNGYSSKCVEFFIFITSFLSFITTILQFFFTKKNHMRLLCKIMLIVLIFLSFIILFSISLILIFRYKETINNKQNKPAMAFSVIGLIITIVIFIIMISEISLTYTHFQAINHPCLYIDYYMNYVDKSLEILEDDNFVEFCIHHQNYHSHIISLKEFIMSFAFAFLILISMLSLIYSWFNEYRRIKYLVDGSLYNFAIKEFKNEKNFNEEIDVKKEEKEEESKQVKSSKNENNNDNDINNENNKINMKNEIIKSDIKKNHKNKFFNDGISIYMNKNSNKIVEGSSDNIITENTEKPIIKNK